MCSYALAVSIFWLFHIIVTVRTTYFTVGNQMRLIDKEPEAIAILQKYIESENTRLDTLTKFHNAVEKNIELYGSDDELAWNALAIFRTTKQLIPDFEKVKNDVLTNSYEDTTTKTLGLPNEDDLYEVIRNLLHLQNVYRLTTVDMMGGHLGSNRTVESALSAEDCFYIGKKSAEKHDHESAVSWLRGCEAKFDEVMQDEAANILVASSLFVGDKGLSKESISKCMRKDATNRKLQDLGIKLSVDLNEWQHNTEYEQSESFKTCAGDYEAEILTRNLKCRYNHHNSPFLTIAPLKEEMLSLVPKVSIFREAVLDSEIEELKADAYDLFRTATVLKDQEGRTAADLNYRPSQTAFVDNKKLKYMKLYERLQDLSALSLDYSEMFQMLHYAPGGFYRVHADYLLQTPDVVNQGNRVATALMYLSDVTSGGGTVFPHQKLMVIPVKGSVLCWMNMRADGSEEFLNRHAACPVIYGEKIACTQWFRVKGQKHWIAEPEDDVGGIHSVNPHRMCRIRHETSRPLI